MTIFIFIFSLVSFFEWTIPVTTSNLFRSWTSMRKKEKHIEGENSIMFENGIWIWRETKGVFVFCQYLKHNKALKTIFHNCRPHWKSAGTADTWAVGSLRFYVWTTSITRMQLPCQFEICTWKKCSITSCSQSRICSFNLPDHQWQTVWQNTFKSLMACVVIHTHTQLLTNP